jgi:ATP-dependent Clp protease ATP-binding subunit ClpB
MKRLVKADRAYVEGLFARIGIRGRSWSKALYPPGCDPRRGSVEFHAAPSGTLLVRVERRQLESDDARVRMLFATGVAVFTSVDELYAFAKGPLAQAFGIEIEEEGEADDDIPSFLRADPRTERRPVALTPAALAERLADRIKGQGPALARVAHVVCAQLAKKEPARPGTMLLLGPTGTGKTSTIEALPGALAALGRRDAHLFRVDCNELNQALQVSRLIGAPPGYVGYGDGSGFLDALARPGVIVLLDEIDKAHPSLVHELLLTLLDTGRVSMPNGEPVAAAHALIAMTSNRCADEVEARLHRIPLDNRWAVRRECQEALGEHGFPTELLERIGAFAVYGDLDEKSLREAAIGSIERVVAEYGLRSVEIHPVVVDVVLDIAAASGLGARGLDHAAGDLLSEALVGALAEGAHGSVTIDPGPPPTVLLATRRPLAREPRS